MSSYWLNQGGIATRGGVPLICDICPCPEEGSSSSSSSSGVELGSACINCLGETPKYVKLTVPQLFDSWNGMTLNAGTYELTQYDPVNNPCCFSIGLGAKILWVSIATGLISAGWVLTGACTFGFPSKGQARWQLTNTPPAKWDCMVTYTLAGVPTDAYLSLNPPPSATLTV